MEQIQEFTTPPPPATPAPSAPEVQPPYETSCPLCGTQIHFARPLKNMVRINCPECFEWVSVR